MTYVLKGAELIFVPNTVFESPDKSFYISYNDRDKEIFGDVTTALVIYGLPDRQQGEIFCTLKGDHRKAYQELIPLGLNACFYYFVTHHKLISKFSEVSANYFIDATNTTDNL